MASFIAWESFTLFICFLLPLPVLLALRKKSRQKLLACTLWGAAGFVVSQLCIRIPLLQVGRLSFRLNLLPVWQQALVLAFSAALFESCARLIVLKGPLARRHSYVQGLAAGIGHGWVEAAALVGASAAANLVLALAYQAGGSALAAQMLGISPLQAQQAVGQILAAPAFMFGVAGLERLFTICFHTAMMLLLLLFIERRQTVWGFFLVVALHTAMDLCAALFGQSHTLLVEGLIAIEGVGSVLFCLWAKKQFPENSGQGPAPEGGA